MPQISRQSAPWLHCMNALLVFEAGRALGNAEEGGWVREHWNQARGALGILAVLAALFVSGCSLGGLETPVVAEGADAGDEAPEGDVSGDVDRDDLDGATDGDVPRDVRDADRPDVGDQPDGSDASDLNTDVPDPSDARDIPDAVAPDAADVASDAPDLPDADACDRPVAWYLDDDRDGFGNPQFWVEACEAPPLHVANGDDCDDENRDIFPGSHATEFPHDGIDVNCDGIDLCLDGRCDGYPDLVLTSTGIETGRIFYGGEDGLDPDDSVGLGGGRSPTLDSGDIDGDGYVDLVLGFFRDGFIGANYIYWGSPEGFTTHTTVSGVASNQVLVADIDGNGLDDIIIPSAVTLGNYAGGVTRIWFGRPDRAMPDQPDRTLQSPGAFYVTAAAMTPGNRLDLVVSAVADTRNFQEVRNVSSRIWTGSSNYTDHIALPTFGAHRHTVLDVDGDNSLDVVFACRLQDGNDQPPPPSLIYFGPDFAASLALETEGPNWVESAQFDGGDPELIFTGESGVAVFPNVTRFGHQMTRVLPAQNTVPSVGDVDGDGHDDLLVPGWDNVVPTTVHWGGPGGLTDDRAEFAAGRSSTSLIRDVTGDGRPDLIVGEGGLGGSRIYPNVSQGRLPDGVNPIRLGPSETFDILVLPGKSAW